MQTRREQVQAYRFAQARMESALLAGEPDRPEPPLRRAGVAMFAGVMVAVIVACGFGVYGLLNPANKGGWDKGVLVVEKETGARFVYDAHDQALHPVLNYASARLMLGKADLEVRQYSRGSLAGVRRGAPRGVAGLPDALPGRGALVSGPWVVCSSSDSPTLTVSVGTRPSGRRLGGQGLLVRSPDGLTYLVWNDTRLQIPLLKTKPMLRGLGLDGMLPTVVSATWLNSVAAGPDLAAPLMSGVGLPVGYRVTGHPTALGQVFKVHLEAGQGDRYYVALRDGMAPISDMLALVLLSDPDMQRAYGYSAPEATNVQAADLNAVPPKAPFTVAGMPESVPQKAQESAVCAAFTDLSGNSTSSAVYVGSTVPGAAAVAGAPQPAVRVVVPPGAACLVRRLPHAGQESRSVYVVTDQGAKYPVPSDAVQQSLGYAGVKPVPVPNGILDLVPTGATLDPGRVTVDLPVADPAVNGIG